MNFICPFCFKKHTENDLIYRCTREGSCRFNITFTNTGSIPTNSVKICQKKCDQRIVALCPEENKPIPASAMNQSMSIGMLGGRSSGKSNYIAVLINEIRQKMSLPFNCAVMECDDSTRQRYQDYFYKRIFKEHAPVDSTASGKQDPLLYTLTFSQKKMFGSNKISSLFLPLYDTAGENMESEESIAINSKYINNANGLILLLDPFEIDTIAEQLKENGISAGASESAEKMETILTRILSIIKGKSMDKVIDIPIAVVLTKLDLLTDYTNLISPQSVLRMESAHLAKQAYSINEHETINSEVRQLLSSSPSFNNAFQLLKNFKNSSFFAVSSFGCDPNVSDLKKKMRPRRVLDPLLWLLSLNGLIKKI